MMRFFSAAFILFSFASCFSIKPEVTKAGKNLWEEFYVSPGVAQYFIKPLSFNSNENRLEIDFTFRTISDSVTVNYSIFSDEFFSTPVKIAISNSLITITIDSTINLISEKVQKKFKIRQSGKISLNDFKALAKNGLWTVALHQGNNRHQFFPAKKTIKKAETIEQNIMPMLRN